MDSMARPTSEPTTACAPFGPAGHAPAAATRRPRPLVTRLCVLALVVAGLSAGLFGVHRLAIDQLNRRLSRAAGMPVRIGDMYATLGPSVVLHDLQVGADARPVLMVDRAEVLLEPRGLSRPRVRRIALLRPALRLAAEQTDRWLATAPTRSSGRGGDGGPGDAVLAAPRPALEVRDGHLELEIGTSDGGTVGLECTEVFVAPRSRGGRMRLVAGRSRVSRDGVPVLELSSTAADLDPRRSFRPTRVASLGGVVHLRGSRSSSLNLVLARLEQRLGGAEYQLQLALKPLGRSTGRVVVEARLDHRLRPRGERALWIELRSVALGPFEPLFGRTGLQPRRTRLSGQLVVDRRGGRVGVDGWLAVRGLTVDHPLVARHPVGPFDAQLLGKVVFDPADSRIEVRELKLDSGGVQLGARGDLSITADRSRVALELQLPKTPCQQLLGAVPAGLADRLRGMALRGDIGLEARLALDTADLDRTEVELAFRPLGCEVRADPPRADVQKLKQALAITVTGARGKPVRWALGEDNPHFLALRRIPRKVRAAFVVAEDALFYRHDGFDAEQLRNAFVTNLKQGRVARGASTISQQLIKNVFLGHQRTLARKFQEAVLTWRLEQVVSKRRILELYLNLVELGPGIHGVDQASRHYFGVASRRLTPLQAAHLAALTPSPRYLGQRFRTGQTSVAWTKRLRLLLRLMRRQGTITREEQRRWANGQLSLLQH